MHRRKPSRIPRKIFQGITAAPDDPKEVHLQQHVLAIAFGNQHVVGDLALEKREFRRMIVIPKRDSRLPRPFPSSVEHIGCTLVPRNGLGHRPGQTGADQVVVPDHVGGLEDGSPVVTQYLIGDMRRRRAQPYVIEHRAYGRRGPAEIAGKFDLGVPDCGYTPQRPLEVIPHGLAHGVELDANPIQGSRGPGRSTPSVTG